MLSSPIVCIFLLLAFRANSVISAFSTRLRSASFLPPQTFTRGIERTRRTISLAAESSPSRSQDNDDEEEEDSDDGSSDKNPPSSADPTLDWNVPKLDEDAVLNRKLGIDIGGQLEPLTQKEAAELKAAATEIINDAVAAGLDDIEGLRKQMKKDLETEKRRAQLKSEWNAEQESSKLMNKIDAMTNKFMRETSSARSTTKAAAAADAARSENEGIELGSWGTLGGAEVTTGVTSLLGSVQEAQQRVTSSFIEEDQVVVEKENCIVIVADEQQDSLAKQLLPLLAAELQRVLNGCKVNVYKPTDTLPLGGDNSGAAILFLTSFSDRSSVNNAIDRLLRKTIQDAGRVGLPPTQLVAISTVGTERTSKMPYTMQNMMSGGSLEKRRQMEEAVINVVQQRMTLPALDYTICKLGDTSKGGAKTFDFAPGDSLDGSLDLDAAVTVLTQAIALQPAARNATFSCVGTLPKDDEATLQPMLDDAFLRLAGPELLRMELSQANELFDPLVEFVRAWALKLAEKGKGLTTPIRVVAPRASRLSSTSAIQQQAAVQLQFLPTATGKNYLSRDEEIEREKQMQQPAAASTTATKKAPKKKSPKEGGVEVVVELVAVSEDAPALRVRAKRCNYADGSVIKELSEETIVSRLKKAIEVWKKEN